jgi:hypothetical protein
MVGGHVAFDTVHGDHDESVGMKLVAQSAPDTPKSSGD